MEENMNIPHGNEGKGLPVCVTGVGGYIGSWLVKTLLENGYTVHATLRDPHNPSKNSSLLSLSGAQERLRLFRADLCEEGSFDYAIHGCHGVFHVATPTDFGSQDPEREVIETAVRGTLNVLKSCLATKSVRHVVYTSSASVASFPEKPVKIIDESCWSSVDLIRQNKPPGWMYYVSKTLADQAALQFAKENKMEVYSIVPVTVVGPWLTTTIPSSVDVTMSLITGMGATLNACKPKKGSIVAVFGLGVVGLAACEGARIAGAARIIGIDFNNERYERAKQFGVTEFINPKEYEKPIQQVIAEKTDGGVDCSVECTGSIEAMVQALECCHDGWGVAVLTGVPRSDAVFKTNPVNFLSEKTLKGTFFGNYKPRTDLPGLVEMYLNRELELDKFVTDKVSFADINKAFDHMLKGEGLRTVIKFIQD